MVRKVVIFVLITTISCTVFAQTIDTQILPKDNLYKGWFTEPVEIMYFIMWDGSVFRITSFLENAIYLNIEQFLDDTGYEYSDIMVCIHNHFHTPYPSDTDVNTFFRMIAKGFRGWYLIYMQSSGQVIWVMEKGKNVRK